MRDRHRQQRSGAGRGAAQRAQARALRCARAPATGGVPWRGERFDLAVANPPYIAADDPHLARPAPRAAAGADRRPTTGWPRCARSSPAPDRTWPAAGCCSSTAGPGRAPCATCCSEQASPTITRTTWPASRCNGGIGCHRRGVTASRLARDERPRSRLRRLTFRCSLRAAPEGTISAPGERACSSLRRPSDRSCAAPCIGLAADECVGHRWARPGGRSRSPAVAHVASAGAVVDRAAAAIAEQYRRRISAAALQRHLFGDYYVSRPFFGNSGGMRADQWPGHRTARRRVRPRAGHGTGAVRRSAPSSRGLAGSTPADANGDGTADAALRGHRLQRQQPARWLGVQRRLGCRGAKRRQSAPDALADEPDRSTTRCASCGSLRCCSSACHTASEAAPCGRPVPPPANRFS